MATTIKDIVACIVSFYISVLYIAHIVVIIIACMSDL